MLILSLECSATPASAALIKDGKIIASSFVNVKITHSETLMPIVTDLIKNAKLTLSDIDGFAVSKGPGSFTGIRIGIAAIKGLALKNDKKTVGVSTLEAIAKCNAYYDGIILSLMDARCSQVYNAVFRSEKGKLTRLCEDRAISVSELKKEIEEKYKGEKIILAGDGTDVFYTCVKDFDDIQKAYAPYRYQSAVGVALLADEYFKNNEFMSAKDLLPIYLRLPQAERELKSKKGDN